ncbi:MAG: hypothetical protein GY913_17060 [Proteobacteria bacterium]|nr:hypothetical protein [Pseudomonadota bacterium]MCP4918615.1 hypothetical protein [Pseudomonadota bacterium]
MLFALLACAPPTSTADVGGLEEPAGWSAVPDLMLTENPASVLAPFATLDDDRPWSLEFEATDVSLRRTDSSSGDRALLGLRADTTYRVRGHVETDDGLAQTAWTEWTTGSLPFESPAHEIVVPLVGPDDGVAVVFGLTRGANQPNLDGVPYLFAVDRKGEVVWYLNAPAGPAEEHFGRFIGDEVWIVDGSELTRYGLAGDHLGTLLSPDVVHHDFEPLEDGNVLVLSREVQVHDVEGFGEQVEVVGDVILELDDNGDIVWSWSAFDHMDVQHNPTAFTGRNWDMFGFVDWTHANSLTRNDDGDVLISMRHQSAVLLIDRETGEILREFGDGSVRDGPAFWGQHAAEMTGDQLTLYDNFGEDESRAVRYDVRDDGLYESVSHTTGGVYETHGSVRTVGADLLIGSGGARRSDLYPEVRVTQVADDGTTVWELVGFVDAVNDRADPIQFAVPVDQSM